MLTQSLKIAKLYDCSSYGHNIEHNGLSYELMIGKNLVIIAHGLHSTCLFVLVVELNIIKHITINLDSSFREVLL